MPDIVKNPILKIYQRWEKRMKSAFPDAVFSQDPSATMAKDKKKYARLYMMGNPGARWDLEGDECATMPAIQVECFATDPKGDEMAYRIDEKSHEIMTGMGFRRTYGPEILQNTDSRIKRVTSRYSRLYAGMLLGENKEY